MDIKEIRENFPVSSSLNQLLINLVAGGYFDFRLTTNRRNLYSSYLKDEYSMVVLSEKHGISNSRAKQLIANSLGTVAQFVLKHSEALQDLYSKSLQSEEAKSQLQNFCYNISPYYQKIYNPIAPEVKKPLAPLDFQIKVLNLLKKANINSAEDLCHMTASKLMTLHRMGEGTLNEIRSELAKYGLKLKDD